MRPLVVELFAPNRDSIFSFSMNPYSCKPCPNAFTFSVSDFESALIRVIRVKKISPFQHFSFQRFSFVFAISAFYFLISDFLE